jgi:hypothetical protein
MEHLNRNGNLRGRRSGFLLRSVDYSESSSLSCGAHLLKTLVKTGSASGFDP